MKKILLTLAFAFGSFFAQAQDEVFIYGLFDLDGTTYARLVDENVEEPCFNNYEGSDVYKYIIDSSQRLIVTRNGEEIINAPSTAAIRAQFDPAVNLLISVRSREDLTVTGVIPSSQYN